MENWDSPEKMEQNALLIQKTQECFRIAMLRIFQLSDLSTWEIDESRHSDNTFVIQETGLDQWSKFEFTIHYDDRDGIRAVEVFDNPADEWEVTYKTLDSLQKRIENL